MFKIVSYLKDSGKTLITVQTDDATSALMLRFLSAADKFAELFHYRLRTESQLDASQKCNPEKMAQASRSRADLLKRFRQIPGFRPQRMKMLKEMLLIEGEEITLDRLTAKLQLAVEEEKGRKQMRVKRLIKQGKSLREIADMLQIPKSTAGRYARAEKAAKASLVRVVGRRAAVEPWEDRKTHEE